ncbi:MAG TPA: response regulator [Candidatus Saccharimonadales bacterium]|nr:response regulator [Candidatus Saccharimonadales bacterium]
MAKLLLIESDALLAAAAIKVLSESGHTVDWQVDPQEALDLADKELPELIVLDIMLAAHSGVEFLYEFRSYPDWRKIPVVIYCSLSAEELKEALSGFEHLSLEAYHYKPNTSLAELAASVERILMPAAA